MLKIFGKKWIAIGALCCLSLGMLFVQSCTEDDPIQARFVQNLTVEIIAGPKEGGSVLNNEFFTFEWRALTQDAAGVTFTIQLSNVDSAPISTTEVSKTYTGQAAGSYTFTVTAQAGSESASAARTFTVAGSVGPPEVVISGARGSSSQSQSVVPAYAPGQQCFVRWTGEDPDTFGEVAGYRWKISDSEPFNEQNMATVTGFDVPATLGEHTFTLEAMDNVGDVSTTTFKYEVKGATIVIVDDKPQGDPLEEIAEDGFYASIFEGFAFSTWDISVQGAPAAADLTPFEVAVVYSSDRSALWVGIGTDYPEAPVALSTYVDGGGKLWVMGQGIMEEINLRQGHDNPPAATEFEVVYLHLAAATGDTLVDPTLEWSRAGNFDGDLQFTFADNVLGDPINFPRIAIRAQAGDVDEFVAGAGAEIIYTGAGGLGDPVGDVGLRFPAGGANTEIVFFAFPLFETSAAAASLIDSRTLTQQIMKEMGQ